MLRRMLSSLDAVSTFMGMLECPRSLFKPFLTLLFSSGSSKGARLDPAKISATTCEIRSVVLISRCLEASERFSRIPEPCHFKSKLLSIVSALLTPSYISAGANQFVNVATKVARAKGAGTQRKRLQAPRPEPTRRQTIKRQLRKLRSRDMESFHSL